MTGSASASVASGTVAYPASGTYESFVALAAALASVLLVAAALASVTALAVGVVGALLSFLIERDWI